MIKDKVSFAKAYIEENYSIIEGVKDISQVMGCNYHTL
jgi:hypothetical protein